METALHPDAELLVQRSLPFLKEARDRTAGAETELWLNRTYGPGSELYETLARLVRSGVEDGWAANVELDGPRYRRSRLVAPSERTFYFSITAVYIDSTGSTQGNPGQTYRGQYHSHPYGELNMVVPIDAGAAIAGPNGWCHAGWTSPPPGSHHYPEVLGGALIALFFLPAGRIAYMEDPYLAREKHVAGST